MSAPADLAGRSAGQHPAHRGSIFLEDGRVLEQVAWPGEQYVLRIHAPQCAARAEPGLALYASLISTALPSGPTLERMGGIGIPPIPAAASSALTPNSLLT